MKQLEIIDRSNWLGLRDYALILFLYATGLRVSECLSMHEEDIEGEWLRVRHTKGEKNAISLLQVLHWMHYAPIKKHAHHLDMFEHYGSTIAMSHSVVFRHSKSRKNILVLLPIPFVIHMRRV